MDEGEYKILKAKFFKAIANVPLPLREEVIAAVGEQTFSWNTANLELKKDGKMAKAILEQLQRIGVLHDE